MERFELTDPDWSAVELAKDTARLFLRLETLSARQIVGLGNALYALERLPEATPGVWCDFGISYRAGTKEFHELRYIEFSITETMFEISVGGSTYDAAVGSDSYSEPGWLVEVDGSRNCDQADLVRLQDSISEYLNLGAKIVVRDESDIEYE